MRKCLLYFFCLLGIAGFLFLRSYPFPWLRLMKTSPKTFSGTPVGEEYAWNRDGSIIQASDRLAVMKGNADLDELILVTDPESEDFRWTGLDKAKILRWNLETDRLILTVSENGEETERIYYMADLVPAETR